MNEQQPATSTESPASLATVGGALGASLESDEVVRQAAYASSSDRAFRTPERTRDVDTGPCAEAQPSSMTSGRSSWGQRSLP
jgi:hypothetical protein